MSEHTGICSVCGSEVFVNPDGTAGAHIDPRTGVTCDGWLKPVKAKPAHHRRKPKEKDDGGA